MVVPTRSRLVWHLFDACRVLSLSGLLVVLRLQVLQPRQSQRITIIIDLAGVKFRDLVGESLAFLKTSVGMMSRHYPQRSFKVGAVGRLCWVALPWRECHQPPTCQRSVAALLRSGLVFTDYMSNFDRLCCG